MTALLPFLLLHPPTDINLNHIHLISESSAKMPNLPPPKNQKKKERRYFMVFSTSCDPFQNWQALAFFHFAHKVNQPGNVTRLVSGCKPEEAEALKKLQDEKISMLSDRFQLHVTPDFEVGGGNLKYWNKPKGLLDWMENVLGFPDNADEYKDDVIIIVDPDMMLLRPITDNFDDYRLTTDNWVGEQRHTRVSRGKPIAQAYAYGNSWLTSLKGNLSYVVGDDSPALQVSVKEAELYYPAGPPYLATGKDMYDIAFHWVRFLPRLYELFPHFMVEMHGYSVSAAHLKLPHHLNRGFMVSNVGGNEGFDFLKEVSRANACKPIIPQENLPLVMHYCQRYALGRWFFSKYKLREDIFDCDAPMLREPPLNVGQMLDWNIFPNGVEMRDYKDPSKHRLIVEDAWMLCTIVYAINEVAISFKKNHCDSNANFEKTVHFHAEENFTAFLKDPSNPFH